MNRLSFSKLGLAHACAFGFRADVHALERPPGRAARLGSIVHTLVEARVAGRAMVDDVDATLLAEAKAIFEGPLLGFVDGTKWTVCEAGYRYDSTRDACVDGPRRGETGYDDVPAHVLHGTVDLVRVDGCTGYVVDVKTGRPPSDPEQLYAQAVSVSRRFGLTKVTIAYARALKTKLELLDEETLDEDRLDEEAGRIRRLLRVLPDSEPNPGEHCWKCDAWSVCPAKRDDDRYVPPEAPADLYDEGVRLF